MRAVAFARVIDGDLFFFLRCKVFINTLKYGNLENGGFLRYSFDDFFGQIVMRDVKHVCVIYLTERRSD